MKRNLLVMLSIVLMLLAFISCTNDNSSGLPDTEASAVAEKIDPVQLMNDALKGKISGATVTFRQVKDAATLIAVVEFDNATYNGFKISSGRLSYTLTGNLTGSSFRATSYAVTTEVELSISEVSTGATATTVTIEVPETTTSSTGSSVTATVTANTEGEVTVSVSNVSISLPSSGAQVTVGGNDVTDTIDQEPGDRDPVGPTYQPIADAEGLTNAFKNGGYYRLTGNIPGYDGTGLIPTEDQEACYNIPGSTVVIDLNGYTLTSKVRLALMDGADVTFSNGSVNLNVEGFTEVQSALRLYGGSSLTLDKVNFSSNIVGLFFVYQNNSMTLRILNGSTVKTTEGAYAIGTNATEPNPSASVTLEISSNSTVSSSESSCEENTAILFNVNGTVSISDSTISGKKQALILRGGAEGSVHHITNSTLEAKGVESADDYLDGDWGTGNSVPLAALVIGNRSASAYKHPVSVDLENVTITVPAIGSSSTYHGIYVYENSEKYPVSVSGSCASATTVNAEKNGAAFNVSNTVILPSDVNAEMQEFMTAFKKVNNQFTSGHDVTDDEVIKKTGIESMYINLGNFGDVADVELSGHTYASNDSIIPVSVGMNAFYSSSEPFKFDTEGNLLVNKAAFMFSLIADTGISVNGEDLEGYSLRDDAETALAITEIPDVVSGSGTIDEVVDGEYNVTLTGPNVQIRYKYNGMANGDIVYVITKQNDKVSQNSLLISDDNGAYAYLTPWGEALEEKEWTVSKKGFVLDSNGKYKGEYNLTLHITSTP